MHEIHRPGFQPWAIFLKILIIAFWVETQGNDFDA